MMQTCCMAIRSLLIAAILSVAAFARDSAPGEVTFFSFSDSHYGADGGGKRPPITQSSMVPIINTLPGVAYPPEVGGVVGTPKGIIMQGDLINDGAVKEKYPTQWKNYIADFGVNGEGRCKFPVFEGLGNHDANTNLFVFNKIKERNLIRRKLNYIGNISENGYHYSWDWGGIHFVNVNLFPGNVWEGEADSYGRAHHPQFARDFLADDLKKHVGKSGKPVIVVQHFRPIDENWWTYSAADKYHKVLQDYNIVAVLVGHQGGGVNNRWRGYNWISSNGELVVCRIKGSQFSAITRSKTGWGRPLKKTIYFSYASSGLAAVVNNGAWPTDITSSTAVLSARIVYEGVSPSELTVYWGEENGGVKAGSWKNSRKLGVHEAGRTVSCKVTDLKPWTTYYCRAAASNARGSFWAGVSIPFTTAGILPDGWQAFQVGHFQRPGGGSHLENGAITMRGSGRDIAERGEHNDNFQYAARNVEGDCEIVARIAATEGRSREPKSGVMLRASGDAGARNVALLLLPGRGVRLSFRNKDRGPSITKFDRRLNSAPCWVKLNRVGNTFTGYTSADGKAWTRLGPAAMIDMPSKVFAGLAVTSGSRDDSRLHTATFDHVAVSGKNVE